MKRRIIIGISGASGIPVAVEILKMLESCREYESHLVISESGKVTIGYEGGVSIEQVEAMADYVYENRDIGSAIASGTFQSVGMIIVPCSMKTVAGIAGGYSDSLLLRGADVMLKERKRLILMTRECPFSLIHLKNMQFLSQAGADILPLVMTFYNHPRTIEEMVHHLACKALERFGIETADFHRWKDIKNVEEEKQIENVN